MTADAPIYMSSAVPREAAPSTTTLTDLLERRLENLQRLAHHIELEHAARTTLSAQLRDELAHAQCTVHSDLRNQPDWPAHDPRRALLDNRLALLDAEVRRERVTCWHDHANLFREWRQWRHQHDDLAQRLRLLTPRDTAP